jgi:hypothetical protein
MRPNRIATWQAIRHMSGDVREAPIIAIVAAQRPNKAVGTAKRFDGSSASRGPSILATI